MLSNTIKDIECIYSNISLRIIEANKSIVEEYIKPLLIEVLLLSQ